MRANDGVFNLTGSRVTPKLVFSNEAVAGKRPFANGASLRVVALDHGIARIPSTLLAGFVGVAIHLLVLVALPNSVKVNSSQDFRNFYAPVARNLLHGAGLTDDAQRPALLYPPGMPVLYAGVFALSRPYWSWSLRCNFFCSPDGLLTHAPLGSRPCFGVPSRSLCGALNNPKLRSLSGFPYSQRSGCCCIGRKTRPTRCAAGRRSACCWAFRV